MPKVTMISKKQIQIIKIAVSRLGIDEADYRDILRERYGVDSSTKLTARQAGSFIDHLQEAGFSLTPKKKASKRPALPRRAQGNVIGLVSKEELEKIDALRGLIRWRVADGFHGWMKKFFRIDSVRTSAQAEKVIEGLKKMFENQMKADYGDDWFYNDYENEAIQDYMITHCWDKCGRPLPRFFRK